MHDGIPVTEETFKALSPQIVDTKTGKVYKVDNIDTSDPEKIKVEHEERNIVFVKHQHYDRFTDNGSKLFKNIFGILKNPNVTARTSTDTGFLIMFQSILILQGAKVQVKVGE